MNLDGFTLAVGDRRGSGRPVAEPQQGFMLYPREERWWWANENERTHMDLRRFIDKYYEQGYVYMRVTEGGMLELARGAGRVDDLGWPLRTSEQSWVDVWGPVRGPNSWSGSTPMPPVDPSDGRPAWQHLAR